MLRIGGLSLSDRRPNIAHYSLTGLQQGEIAVQLNLWLAAQRYGFAKHAKLPQQGTELLPRRAV
jgi:hypothetical protein